MKSLTLITAVLFAAALLFPSTSSAELKPDDHTGFYIGLGIGGGSAKVNIDNYESDAESSGAGQLRLGGAVSQTVLLGIESNAWTKQYDVFTGDELDGTETWTVSNVAATVTFYPTHYFFIKAGPALGIVNYEFKPEGSGGKYTNDATGGGFMFGAGGELRLTRRFALVPSAQWMWQRITADLGFGEVDADVSFFSLTLGVGWFW